MSSVCAILFVYNCISPAQDVAAGHGQQEQDVAAGRSNASSPLRFANSSSASSAWESRLRVCCSVLLCLCSVLCAELSRVYRSVVLRACVRYCCVCVLCRQALSARDAHEISDTAAQDGCSNKSVIGLSKLGNRGRHLGNLYRDLLRMTRRQHQHISVYDVDTVVQNPNMTSQSLKMLLPHEWFSALYHRDRNAFHKVMGTDTCEEFRKIMAACNETWLKHHEYS